MRQTRSDGRIAALDREDERGQRFDLDFHSSTASTYTRDSWQRDSP